MGKIHTKFFPKYRTGQVLIITFSSNYIFGRKGMAEYEEKIGGLSTSRVEQRDWITQLSEGF